MQNDNKQQTLSNGNETKSDGKKYIPPHLRGKVEEQTTSKQTTSSSEPRSEPKKSFWTQQQEQKREEKPTSQRWKSEPQGDRFKSFGSSKHYVEEREDVLFKDSKETNTGENFDKYHDIPVEVSGEDWDKEKSFMKSFGELDIDKRVYDNVARAKYNNPTPIQKYAVPVVLAERDLMACASTGSGKTCAFLYGIIHRMLKEGTQQPTSKSVNPTCVILSPTRELTLQIHNEAKKFCFKTGIIPQVVYGGEEVREQLKEIFKGCDILVATPGRLLDLIERGKVNLSYVKHLVLDEADKMLDMGFEPQIRQIIEKEGMPETGKRQTLMFSATFPREIQGLASDFLENYIFVTIGTIGATSQFITQKIEYVSENEKKELLLGLLKNTSLTKTLVFTETKKTCDELEYFLTKNSIKSDSIHGGRTQSERNTSLNLFKKGQIDVLVATSVAARGLDISEVSHVINFDLPSQIDDYVHRIGRTGRCGHAGLATSFFTDNNRGILKDLYQVLCDADQEIPHWMEKEVEGGGRSFGPRGRGRGRGGRGGGKQFGSRDYRKTYNDEKSEEKPSYSSGYKKDSSESKQEGRGFKWN